MVIMMARNTLRQNLAVFQDSPPKGQLVKGSLPTAFATDKIFIAIVIWPIEVMS